MAASLALAGLGLSGCRRPEERIVPAARNPGAYVHGMPQYFATAMPVREAAVPLLVKCVEGRPIKVEGNPDHPCQSAFSQAGPFRPGPTDLYAQASILALYDPDRSTRFLRGQQTVSRAAAFDSLSAAARRFEAGSGKGLCFLLEPSSSPSRERLRRLVSRKLPQARWFAYEPVGFGQAARACQVAFGKPLRPRYRLANARRVLSLDADLLGAEEDAFLHLQELALSRRWKSATEDRGRLYVVESLATLTGANAEHRLPLPSSSVYGLGCLMLAELLNQGRRSDWPKLEASFRSELRKAGTTLEAELPWVGECARDLLAHHQRSLVGAGYRQPMEVHLLAQACNALLGVLNSGVEFYAPSAEPFEDINELAWALRAGQVDTLVIAGGNPVFNAPADLEWAATQRCAKTVLRLGAYEDETSALADWHLPQAHYLESWGDARSHDGTLVPVQPMIEPLFGGITEVELLARSGGLAVVRPHDLVRETFEELSPGGDSEQKWQKFLHDGYLAGSAPQPVPVTFDWESAASHLAAVRPPSRVGPEHLEITFSRDLKVDDGRYANNGWLQELPDPITKLTWDNALLISPKTAQAIGFGKPAETDQGLRVPQARLEWNGRSLEGPVLVQPGMAAWVVGLGLGYGRRRAGRVGNGVGQNVYPLRATSAMHFAAGARLIPTGKTYRLACAQRHAGAEGQAFLQELARAQAADHSPASTLSEAHPSKSAPPLYPNPLDAPDASGKTPKQKALHWWAMVIDLNACTGCSACVVACQSENNIPIVGKEQVLRRREMHWLRIDRYFIGPLDDPLTVHLPMMCQHCESAPCESVCPVNATVHDAEGLNLMVYNRCVGARFCSNNCPYKVRRFNFFDYCRRPLDRLYQSPLTSATKGEWDLKRWLKDPDRGSRPQEEWDMVKLLQNPEVTVRMRGVMEKCTWCLQRIEQAKIAQKVKASASADVEVPDGAVQTACQQACPAQAITFGNLKDVKSLVSATRAEARGLTMLESLGTHPRLTYLAQRRNPNPALLAQPIAAATGTAREGDGQ
jgi:molybdopterin-containing oxidoreductase family iron-sulfur binding subunit